MEKLLTVSFADLMAVRAYYTESLSDENQMRRPGAKQITLQYIGSIEQAIEAKFEDLITRDEPPGGTASMSTIPTKPTRL